MDTYLACMLAGAATLVAFVPTSADACTAPDSLYVVQATVPADGATGLPLSVPIVVHLGVEELYDFGFSTWENASFFISVSDDAGTVVATSGELTPEVVFEDTQQQVVSFVADGLVPGTRYTAALERSGHTHQWHFVAGPGGPIEEPPVEPVQAGVAAFFALEDVWACCELESIGACPVCSVIGEEPIPAIEATVTPYDHPLGPGAYAYSLQLGDDATGWADVVSRAPEGSPLRLRYEDVRLNNARTCVRVVARSAVEDLEVIGATHCFEPSDFGAEPDPGPYSALSCDEFEDPQEPRLDPEDPPHDPDDEEPMIDDPIVPDDGGDENPGWEFSEGGSADTGCGCVAAGPAPQLPGSVLLLAIVLGIARRGRRRRLS